MKLPSRPKRREEKSIWDKMKGFNREIAIVTGAARGIGKATSLKFKKEGFTVIETDILPDSENKGVSEKPQSEPKDKPMIHDVSDEASWSELVESVFKKYGRIDILVNNAGIGTLPDFEEEDESGWDEMLSVNAKSIWLGIKSVVSIMKSQQSGSIVNVSSIFGASGGFGKSSSYHASKGAVSALTRNAAIRYANDNIRINSVSPGFIKVLREEKTIEEAGDTMSQEILSRTPMGRWGEAEEVAAAIHFLADEESSYITGAELFVDGGWMAT